MRQILLNLGTGEIGIEEIPIPKVKAQHILIKSNISLISSGTERMLLDFGKSNIYQKVKSQPSKVKEVFEKIKSEGIYTTLDAVTNKLDTPIPLGYCNVGIVQEVGENVTEFSKGDRVICNGYHASYNVVSKNLCAKIPSSVSDEDAVFTILASIALQGIRLLDPKLGETILVSGLGLIGLLAVQILKANGCKVLAIDPNKQRCELAKKYDINTFQLNNNEECILWSKTQSKGLGVDGVLITASSNSNSPIDLAPKLCRKRARIILVGSTGLKLNRDEFYKKEIYFQVSSSYGPGRYDPVYEDNGVDYPHAFVRWTAKRNFDACLHLFEKSTLSTKNLITNRFLVDEAKKAYKLINNSDSLGIVLDYKVEQIYKKEENLIINEKDFKNPIDYINNSNKIAFIGSGNYASRILLPTFIKAGAEVDLIISNNGIVSSHLSKKFSIPNISTDINDALFNEEISTIVIATRNDSHADLIIKGLKRNKNVYVEKPLCLNLDSLKLIQKTYKETQEKNLKRKNPCPTLTVGFNRRFSSYISKIKKHFDKIIDPKLFIYTCNAGALPKNHWQFDPNIGGGRLIGEACHFIDLIRFIANSPILEADIKFINSQKNFIDNFNISIKFRNGSIGSINYFSNGPKSFPKERLEIFSAQQMMQLDNFRKLTAYGIPHIGSTKTFKQDKGHIEIAKSFLNSIKIKKDPPIPIEEIYEVQNITLKLSDKLT